jgi:hypothetical protein
MFNIVKRRDFMPADDLPNREETQPLCDEKYPLDHFVVETAQLVPARSRPSADGGSRMVEPSWRGNLRRYAANPHTQPDFLPCKFPS